jgi:hypothetical protein
MAHRQDKNGNGIYGMLREGVGLNTVLRSSALDTAPWVKTGGVAVTENTAETDDPRGPGFQGASKVTGIAVAGADDLNQPLSGYVASAAIAPSLYLKRISTAGVLRVHNPTGTGQWSMDMSALPDAWVWLVGHSTYVTVDAAFAADGAGDADFKFSRPGVLRLELPV